MKIRKRYILLIILSILPFYKIIHFDDYCINDVDYLIIAFLSIIVLITFLAILFYNLYLISIHKELFNYRPFLIFFVFSIALFVSLKYPDIWLMKTTNQQFQHQIDGTSFAKISLFDDNTFLYKSKKNSETCTKQGSFYIKNDSLFLKFKNDSKNQNVLDSMFVFDKNKKVLKSIVSDRTFFSKN